MSYALNRRLIHIWESPNFELLFKKGQRPPHIIKQKNVLFNEGDPLEKLYFIKEGFVKLYRLSDDGKETTIYLLGPGDVLGLRSLISKDKCAMHNAEAMTSIQVVTLSHQEFFAGCIDNPEHLIDLLHLYLNRLIYTESRVEAFITTDTTARVAIFLNYCVKRFGKKLNGKITLPLALTHQLIAEFIGSVRETVTLALKHLASEGILKSEKGKITILDYDKLKKYL